MNIKKPNLIPFPNLIDIFFNNQKKTTTKKKVTKKVKDKSWQEKKFEEEADLWGLSKEDRKIASSERMSPAEYIEAEEYNDDELLKDEWER